MVGERKDPLRIGSAPSRMSLIHIIEVMNKVFAWVFIGGHYWAPFLFFVCCRDMKTPPQSIINGQNSVAHSHRHTPVLEKPMDDRERCEHRLQTGLQHGLHHYQKQRKEWDSHVTGLPGIPGT